MGDLKSCLFCGKNVDRSFQYCPHCGYEFGQGEDLPGLIEETTGDLIATGEQDYLVRLRTLQELLCDMERELDLIIKTSSKDP
jgi:predicted amidophosphoribosyltransferase